MVRYQCQAIFLKSYDNDRGLEFSKENEVWNFGECIYQDCDVIFGKMQVFYEIHGDGFSERLRTWSE